MSTVLANPAEMMAQGAPRVIHTEAELEEYTDALFQLTAIESPSPAEEEAIELLTLLIDRYERENYPIPAADARGVVRFLMERQGLTQRDLISQFGTESAVSMFLSGKRKLTLRQVQRLSERFGLPGDVFLRRVGPAL
jgi:HTH-type transcriptional regulator/antitoxin HigA